jgi:hypothetical protein
MKLDLAVDVATSTTSPGERLFQANCRQIETETARRNATF